MTDKTVDKPEVTGAVVWIRKSSLAWCGVGNGLSQVSFVKREGSDGYVIPLYPPSAIEAAVREKLEEAARICDNKAAEFKNSPDKTDCDWTYYAELGALSCRDAIRALIEPKS